MQKFLSSALFVALATSGAPGVSTAGECFGMLHYTYDAGQCTDTGGDTTQVLIDSSDAGEALNEGIANRSRSSFLVGGDSRRSGSGVDPNVFASVFAGLQSTYRGKPLEPQPIAASISKDAKMRAKLATLFDMEIAAYDTSSTKFPYPLSLVSARIFFMENAYRAFDGEALPQKGSRQFLRTLLGNVMMRAPVNALPMQQKERLRERYIINAFVYSDLFLYYRKRHQAKTSRVVARCRASSFAYRSSHRSCDRSLSANSV